jgi:hypothetical protein
VVVLEPSSASVVSARAYLLIVCATAESTWIDRSVVLHDELRQVNGA